MQDKIHTEKIYTEFPHNTYTHVSISDNMFYCKISQSFEAAQFAI